VSVLDSRDVLIRSLYLEIERLKEHAARRFVRDTLADLGQTIAPGTEDEIVRRVRQALPHRIIECSGGKRIKRKR
jgi:hypothetical protein